MRKYFVILFTFLPKISSAYKFISLSHPGKIGKLISTAMAHG